MRICRPEALLLWLRSDLDLLARRLEALRAHLQIDASLVHRLEGVLKTELSVLEELELLIQLLECLLVGQLLSHDSTSSMRAPSRPAARRTRTLRFTAVPADDRSTAPDSASFVML